MASKRSQFFCTNFVTKITHVHQPQIIDFVGVHGIVVRVYGGLGCLYGDHWLAEKLGLPESEHGAYSKEVVLADLNEPGIEDVIRKVMSDISEKGADVSETDVRQKLEEFHTLAHEQITGE